mgnify:CR=1 FL=1
MTMAPGILPAGRPGPERSPAPIDIPAMAGPSVRAQFERFGGIYRWILLFTMLTGSMATMLAATTINVALPAIIGAFGLGQDQAQWMSTAFLASSTIAMLANAWAMATFGPRATYTFGMIVFVIGSLLGAVSGTLELLILSRGLQGISAGLLQPMSMFLIFQTFPDNKRGTAMGVFSIGVVLAPAFGPALGGIAVDLASWRLVFVATLPLALIAMGIAPFLMPKGDRNPNMPRPPLDWQGLSLLAIAVIGLLAAFAGGNRDGWDSDKTLLRFGIGIVAGILFFLWERGHPFPALNPKIFTYRQFWSAGLIISATGIAIYGSTYLIPLFVQMVQGYSPTAAGVMMIPAGIAMMIGFPIAGRLTDRMDARWLLSFGIVSFATSAWLLSHVSAMTPYWVLVGWIVLSRIGISFCMPPSNTTAARAVPPHLLASAAGGVSFLMQVGGAFGVNILAIVLQRRTIFHGDHLSAALNETNAEMMYQHALQAQRMEMWGMTQVQAFQSAFGVLNQKVAAEALVYAFRDCFFIIFVWFVLVLGALALMPKPKMVQPPS